MKKLFLLSATIVGLLICLGVKVNAQGVGINSTNAPPDPSAMFDVNSTTKGTLITRMTTAQRDAIVNPAQALQIYNLTTKCFEVYENGLWQIVWCAACPSPAQPSSITGNASPCQGTSQSYSVVNVAGVAYAWIFPSGWTQTAGDTSNSVTVSVGAGSGNIQVVPSNIYCGNGPAQILAVTAATVPVAPAASTHSATQTQIVWTWNTVSGATGYRWGTSTNYASATDVGTNTTQTETGLSCGTSYTRYVWSYNSCGNSVSSTTLTQLTTACCSDGTGGTITHVSGNTIHTFTSNGTFTPGCAGNIQILVVAGGGSGGSGANQDGSGGGGAGGLVYNASLPVAVQSYSVIVGSGGAGVSNAHGNNGENSSFGSLITTIGGGGGGYESGSSRDGSMGGSGGGGGGYSGSGGAGTSGQGNGGGNCTQPGDGGGGGAGAQGANGTTGAGGAGLAYSISGILTYYAGGGGGSGDARNSRGTSGGTGGNGGGGAGAPAISGGTPVSGSPNTGGGGGGSAGPAFVGLIKTSGAGGAGIVIISYPSPSCSTSPGAVTEGVHSPSATQIIWNWNTSSGATGYKWNTVNDFNNAIDNGSSTSYTQTGLTCNVLYTLYVWAYNGCGNSSVTTLTQTTSSCSTCGTTVTDASGNSYNTLSIGSQCWLKSNLRTTKYQDGSDIPASYMDQWGVNGAPSCNAPNFNAASCGILYDGNVHQNASSPCPTGWHIPKKSEYVALNNSVGNINSRLFSLAAGCTSNCSGFDLYICGQHYTVWEGCGSGDQIYLWTKPDSGNNFTDSWISQYSTGGTGGANYSAVQSSWVNYNYSIRCIKD